MRRHVPPTFKEIRHIMNIATVRAQMGQGIFERAHVFDRLSFLSWMPQIHAVTPHLRMVTFDADDTIYEDGGTVSRGSPMVDIIVRLLRAGVVVSLVTAAGYPGNVSCVGYARHRCVCWLSFFLGGLRRRHDNVVPGVGLEQVARYESRLRGLLDTFQLFMDMGAPIDMLERFLVRSTHSLQTTPW